MFASIGGHAINGSDIEAAFDVEHQSYERSKIMPSSRPPRAFHFDGEVAIVSGAGSRVKGSTQKVTRRVL